MQEIIVSAAFAFTRNQKKDILKKAIGRLRVSMEEWEKEKNTAGQDAVKEQAEYTPTTQSDFLRETIKQKPVNKKKLLRRTLLTVAMAVVFGLVACFTFLVLEPVISNRLYPEEEAEEVRFPEETATEEMRPEDMLVEEEQEDAAETVPAEHINLSSLIINTPLFIFLSKFLKISVYKKQKI